MVPGTNGRKEGAMSTLVCMVDTSQSDNDELENDGKLVAKSMVWCIEVV